MRTLAWIAIGYAIFSVFSVSVFSIWSFIINGFLGAFLIAALAWKLEYIGRVYSEENGKMLDEVIRLKKEIQELKEKKN